MKTTEIIQRDLKTMLSRFKEALLKPKDMDSRDLVIKRFEIVYELAWKLLRRVMMEAGIDVAVSPKQIFRQAYRAELISDPKVWFDFQKDRNYVVHLYLEAAAENVYKKAKVFVAAVNEVLENVERELREDKVNGELGE